MNYLPTYLPTKMEFKDDIERLNRINVTKVLQRKFDAVQRDKADMKYALEDAFKPITNALKQVRNSNSFSAKEVSTVEPPQEVKRELQSPPPPLPLHFQPKRIKYSENIGDMLNSGKESEKEKGEETKDEIEELKLHNESPSKNVLGDIAAKYAVFFMQSDTQERDKTYGVCITPRGDWMMGNEILEIWRNDIKVKSKWYTGTIGLYELLFKKEPKNYTSSDLKNYIDIVRQTCAHRRNYSLIGQINGNRSMKWKYVLRPALSKAHSGSGLITNKLSLTNKVADYMDYKPYEFLREQSNLDLNPEKFTLANKMIGDIYDPNELVDRLQVIITSTGHYNEIVSIFEKLRELRIIE